MRAPDGGGEGVMDEVWEVWQGQTLICSRRMGLTESQARNKVDNERRRGTYMEAKPAPKGPEPKWYPPEEDE